MPPPRRPSGPTAMADAPHRIVPAPNLVGHPPGWLGSCAFNDAPEPLRIGSVRAMNPSLFTMLEQAADLPEAGDAFCCYMTAVFGLDPEQRAPPARGRTPFRSSFLRLLQGWTFDSNGPEGAVLKGWVESRFGVAPIFHRQPIAEVPGPVWATYAEEKLHRRFHSNAIWAQLDLLFEFCQWAAARLAFPGQTHLTLYRGVNDVDRHAIVSRTGRHQAVIRLNNLVSFSSDREVADCFGDTILTARVPVAKIAYFSGLLPLHLLKSEREFLVVGGDYRVSMDDV